MVSSSGGNTRSDLFFFCCYQNILLVTNLYEILLNGKNKLVFAFNYSFNRHKKKIFTLKFLFEKKRLILCVVLNNAKFISSKLTVAFGERRWK